MNKISSTLIARLISFCAIAFISLFNTGARGDEIKKENNRTVYFNPIFLGSNNINLSRFEKGGSATPGIWPTAIYVNNERIPYKSVRFIEQEDNKVIPCISLDIIKNINFNYSELPLDFREALNQSEQCYSLDTLIPLAFVSYDSNEERLDISIPQSMLIKTARGYTDPNLWDRGISAASLGYNINHYMSRVRGVTSRSFYAGINAGINIGTWYFRHDGSYNWQEHMNDSYQSINNYVERDIPSLQGRIRIGETITKGVLFDTLPFRGIELVSDERMLPVSRRGYAPEVRGIARTNARVKVSQSGRVIYETTVSPGAFTINDLNATGYGGNLEVVVTESDGSVQTFLVPYSSVTQLLRKGVHQYDLVVGRLNDPSISHRFNLYQAIYQRGLTNYVTGFGGIQSSGRDYVAIQLGSSVSTYLGAFSFSATHAKPRFEHSDIANNGGQSYQVSYSKYLQSTNSNLTIAAYRYSTSGYFDYLSAMQALDAEEHGYSMNNIWRPKNRFNITMSQGLPENWGQMYITAYSQDYWNRGSSDLQYQLGYSNQLGALSFSINAGRARNGRGHMENNIFVNFSMPLANRSSKHIPMLNASFNRSGNGRTGTQIGTSGSFGDDTQYNYGVTAANYNQGGGSSLAANGGWRSPATHLTGSYSIGKHYQNMSLGASGTIIGWADGVVMTPYHGNTFAIVEAKNAKGAKLSGYSGIRIDSWGHAAVPYLNPYEMNDISIDPKGLPHDVELNNTTEKVIPYSGAITKVEFKTQRGIPVLIHSVQSNHQPIPFGAEVLDEMGHHVGNVGQNGQIFARVEQSTGQLTVKWGIESLNTCQVSYDVTENVNHTFNQYNSVCR
ncbi:fimbria/pilus outer membrane usher protein [Providencia sp. PROV197]|uniref:fimbria/pilus outer membrane usher protein n=1 Tax=Providencia sp. PROV197 TaxID=2949898 RepID=UPI00234B39C6|nr:fimbria/pilus outer membrane usher protein [Providencia sp. PROV197]